MSKTIAEWTVGDGTRPPIVTTAAWKGGDGKSTVARELAYLLGAVVADLDWDRGGVTRSWGYRIETRAGAPLLEALEKDRTPTPLTGRRKPDLIPSHPDFGFNQPDPESMADALEKWAVELNRPLIVDTHPGGCDSTYGALKAADVVVVPAVLAKASLNALEGMLDELTDYPLLVIPYMVEGSPPGWARRRLREVATQYQIPVGPMVDYYRWIKQRTLNVAICAEPVSQRALPYVRQMDQVADAVINYDHAA